MLLTWGKIMAEVSQLTGISVDCRKGPLALSYRDGQYRASFPDEPANGLAAAVVILEMGRVIAETAGQKFLEKAWRDKLERYCVRLCEC